MPDPSAARSHWGWGRADRFPDREAREGIAQQVAALLRFPPLTVEDPVDLAHADLSRPRLAVPPALAAFCTQDRAERARRAHGRAFPDLLRGFQGEFPAAPDIVARPRTEDEVAAVLDSAAVLDAAVVPYGGGTSVVGGVECRAPDRAGVICLDMGAMDRVREIDTISMAARIQAGATGPALEQQLREAGLTLRFFPQSFEFSTLGGWIATRAGGHFATLHTHIDDLVESVRMLTPTGAWESRRLPGSGAGPSPDRLVLGSEGILGVITEAWVRVRPRPRYKASATLSFDSFDAAAAATRRVVQQGLHPSLCRVLDRREALLHSVSFDGDHLLLLGFESAEVDVAWLLDQALAVVQAGEGGGRLKDGPRIERPGPDRGRTGDAGAAGTWRQAFLDAPYLFSSLVSMGLVVDTFETACTWDAFPVLHERIVTAVRDTMKARCGGGVLACRFTHVYPDGPAPYYTFVAPGDADWRVRLDQWKAIKDASMQAIADAGGTVTHHHAVGRTHRPGYDQQRPDAFARVLRAAKTELDPDWRLNPGVLVDR